MSEPSWWLPDHWWRDPSIKRIPNLVLSSEEEAKWEEEEETHTEEHINDRFKEISSISKKDMDSIKQACRIGWHIEQQPFQFSYIQPGMSIVVLGDLSETRNVLCKQIALALSKEYSYAIVYSAAEPERVRHDQKPSSSSSSRLLDCWSPHLVPRMYVYNRLTVPMCTAIRAQREQILHTPPDGIDPTRMGMLLILEDVDWIELKSNKSLWQEVIGLFRDRERLNLTILATISVAQNSGLGDFHAYTDVLFCCRVTTLSPTLLTGLFFAFEDATLWKELERNFFRLNPNVSRALVVYRAHLKRRSFSLKDQTSTQTSPLKTFFHHIMPSTHSLEEWMGAHYSMLRIGWEGANNLADLFGTSTAARFRSDEEKLSSSSSCPIVRQLQEHLVQSKSPPKSSGSRKKKNARE